MKLIRKGPPQEESPGILTPEGLELDVSSFGEDYDEVFFETDGLTRLQAWLAEQGEELPQFPEGERFGPPVARPSKIVCIGLNFDDHAAESGMEIPEEPVLFFKASSAFCGPNDDLILPRGGEPTGKLNSRSSLASGPAMSRKRMPWIISPATPCTTITANGPFNSREAGNGSKGKAVTPSPPLVPSLPHRMKSRISMT